MVRVVHLLLEIPELHLLRVHLAVRVVVEELQCRIWCYSRVGCKLVHRNTGTETDSKYRLFSVKLKTK